MKTILFDLLMSQPIGTSKYHGGGEYIKAVFATLVREYTGRVRIIAFYDDNRFMDQYILDLIKAYEVPIYPVTKIDGIREILAREPVDAFYSGIPYDYRREWFPEGVRISATIHGLRSLEMPHDRYEMKYWNEFRARSTLRLGYWMLAGDSPRYRAGLVREWDRSVHFPDRIVTDSEHSRYAILTNFPDIHPDHVAVFYPPMKLVEESGAVNQCPVEGKFVLMVGGDRWLKNSYRGLLAMERLYHMGLMAGYKMVLVGSIGEKVKKSLYARDRFVFLDYVEPGVLEQLYKNCDIFLYPTLNEGFGYPPLEVMRFGKTCIVSAVCSLTEICGEAVYYVNPQDVGEIENRLVRASQEKIAPEIVSAQSERILARQRADLESLCAYIAEGVLK